MDDCVICGVEYPVDELVDGICTYCDMDVDWMTEFNEDWPEYEADIDAEYND